jgi:CubicO group peptidase (beta-lactamase class C family)
MVLTEFLKTLKKEGAHGEGFQYRTVNSEVLGWVLRRITGERFSDLLSKRIWMPMRAEQDAYVWVDANGAELMGAGLNITLRDLARVGEMLRQGGQFQGRRVIPKQVVDEIRKGADREKFKKSGMTYREGYSYHNQWWITHNKDGAYEAAGIHGQILYINPAAKMVVVKFSSHPVASNSITHGFNTKALEALAKALGK